MEARSGRAWQITTGFLLGVSAPRHCSLRGSAPQALPFLGGLPHPTPLALFWRALPPRLPSSMGEEDRKHYDATQNTLRIDISDPGHGLRHEVGGGGGGSRDAT